MPKRCKHAFLLGLLLVALAGAGLWYFRWRPPSVRVSLLDLLCQAGTGPFLAPQGPLGDFSASVFLGKQWGPILGEDFRVARGPSDLLFSQTQVVPLEVDLEGRCLANAVPHNLTVSINGHSPEPFTLERDWKHFRMRLQTADLIEGLNRLSLEPSPPVWTQWRSCKVSVEHADYRAPGSLSRSDRVCLYYGTTREFPVLLQPSTCLTLEELSPWNEPDAPPVQVPWELTVRVQSGKAHLDRTWHLTGTGPQRLALPVDVPTEVLLSLTATISADPKPGQSGVVLVQPRLDSWSWSRPAPQGSPTPTPVPVSAPGAAPVTPRPNVVVYLIDTLRADHLHCYGYTNDTSPNIDALAKDAVRFEDCMASASWTKPSSASIQSGLIAHHHRAEDFPDRLRLPKKWKLLAQLLGEAGYETRGLVANPFVGPAFGFGRGFDNYTLVRMAKDPATVEAPKLVKMLEPWLESRGGGSNPEKKPFYLYLHTLDPHMPYHAPQRFLPPGFPKHGFFPEDAYALLRAWRNNSSNPKVIEALAQTKTLYDASIRCNDEAFGTLVATLKSRGLYDNTLIVVVADHGEEFFDHGAVGHMSTLYQELMHVPLIVKFPHNQGAGTVVKPPWQVIDVAPTILHAAGLNVPDWMDGIAYAPGGPTGDPERPAYISITAGAMAAMFGQGNALRKTKLDGIRVGRWVLARAYSSHVSVLEPLEVYDLETDPGEQHNLAYSRPELRGWLYAVLKAQECHGQVPAGAAALASPGDVKRALDETQYNR